jgi:hypothetical protein
VESGLVGRFGALDPSDGGETHRLSLSGEWRRSSQASATHLHGYFIDYALNLFSNFTFFLDDPVNGDQFEQEDDRQVYGVHAHHTWSVAGAASRWKTPWGYSCAMTTSAVWACSILPHVQVGLHVVI